MPGLEPDTPIPTELTLDRKRHVLVLAYGHAGGEQRHELSFEFLRVHSPSAEVQGHGPGQEVLQTGKRHVAIVDIEPVGNYAVKPTFSDGHDSGLFTWEYLYFLGAQEQALWAEYEQRLQAAGVSRDDPMPEKAGSSCGHHH